MSVTSADITIYGAENMVEADTGVVGGQIDRTIKILDQDMGDIGGDDTLEMLSDEVSDALTVTVTGRDAAGIIQTDVFTIAGTSVVTGATGIAFERILKMVTSGITQHLGVITVREASGNVTLDTIEGTATAPGGLALVEVRRPFYDAVAAAENAGADDKFLYEKVFIANSHATLALTTAQVTLTVDGTASNIMDFDLEVAVEGSNTSTDRVTEPAASGMLGSPTWNDTAKSIPGNNLGPISGAAEYIGVWLRMQLDDGLAAENVSMTLRTTGNSI